MRCSCCCARRRTSRAICWACRASCLVSRPMARSGDTGTEDSFHPTRCWRSLLARAALEAEARGAAGAAGKDPNAPPPDRAQRNFTDPESKIQKTGDGFVQGYNAQLAVGEGQIIVAQHVTPAALDVQQVLPAVRRIKATLGAVPKVVLADGGYWSDANVRTLQGQGIDVLIATQRPRRGHHAPPEMAPRGRPPHGLTPQQRMERRPGARLRRGLSCVDVRCRPTLPGRTPSRSSGIAPIRCRGYSECLAAGRRRIIARVSNRAATASACATGGCR